MNAIVSNPRFAIIVAGLAGLWSATACASTPTAGEPAEAQMAEPAATNRPATQCDCPCPAASRSDDEAEYVYVGPRQNVRKRIVRDRD